MDPIYLLYRSDAYLKTASATVLSRTEHGICVDRPLFYPEGGGQPGDTGHLTWDGGEALVTGTRKADGGQSLLLCADDTQPAPGTTVQQHLDWDRRYGLMRMHTALHLLSVVIPLPVTGGAIGAEKSRLDFHMPDAPDDKPGLETALQTLIDADTPVSETWIDEAELDANPDLVKTLSVQPPRGAGRIRLIRIGQVDLQPCGGTHVARTREIGQIRIGKIEKKGRQNRRVYLHLVPG